jgi:cytidine deaminase
MINKDLIKKAVEAAIEARKKAVTFKTAVGASVITKDGRIFSGQNYESWGYNFELHGEQVAIINGMQEGYRTTDFDSLIIVFQSGWHPGVEVYPACPYCWAFLHQFSHLGLNLIVADVDGNVLFETTLKDCIHPPAGSGMYPSEEYRKIKPLSNMEPKLK